MSQNFQNTDLSSDPLHVSLLNDLVFLKDLHCDFLLGGYVGAQLHFSKGALS